MPGKFESRRQWAKLNEKGPVITRLGLRDEYQNKAKSLQNAIRN